eukprot:967627-Pleurochrysis_carterae.AAC.1
MTTDKWPLPRGIMTHCRCNYKVIPIGAAAIIASKPCAFIHLAPAGQRESAMAESEVAHFAERVLIHKWHHTA